MRTAKRQIDIDSFRFSRFVVFTFLLFSIIPVGNSNLEASIVSVEAPKTVSVGQRVSVDVLVDPENLSINSIESTISFSNKFFDYNGFSAKQSSIPIWVEEPKEKTRGNIYFSGVIPGGIDRLYDPMNTNNKSIPIVRLFFIAKSSGISEFVVKDSQVLQNDGKGTSSPITNKNISIQINADDSRSSESLLAEDLAIPEPFNIAIIERSVFGKTPRLAVFSAQDDQGGIEHYEVAVGNLGFQKVTSPFPLPYRLFSYSLTARAYDYSGNFREQQIIVPGEKPYGLGILALALFLAFIGYRFYNSRRKKI
jgi:hypothetical protein